MTKTLHGCCWVSHQQAEVMERIREKVASEPVYEPMSQEEVGEEVEKSLG